MIILSAYVLLCIVRVPAIVFPGRFWAEEATVYFHEAYCEPLSEVFSQPRQGYYSLYNKLACLTAASAVPLRFAPLVTTLFAGLAQILPVALLWFSKIEGLASWRIRIAAILVLLLVQPNQEVWLNTGCSQFFLCVAAGIVLVSEPTSWKTHVGRLAILAVAGLTGILSCLLLPGFLFESWRSRSRHRMQETAVLAAVTAIQFCFVMYAASERPPQFHWSVLPWALLAKQWLLPLSGAEATNFLSSRILGRELFNHPLLSILALLPYVFVGGGLAIWGRRQSQLLFVLGAAIASFSFLVSYESQDALWVRCHVWALPAGRYYYAPNFFCALAVLMSLRPNLLHGISLSRVFRRGCVAAIGLMLAVGSYDYATSTRRHACWLSGPDWPAQVRAWEEGKTNTLAIWPAPWVMELPAHENAPCSESSPQPSAFTDGAGKAYD
jgi:hypothetical protein